MNRQVQLISTTENQIFKHERNVTGLGGNETGKADLGKSTSSKFTPGFYKCQPKKKSSSGSNIIC